MDRKDEEPVKKLVKNENDDEILEKEVMVVEEEGLVMMYGDEKSSGRGTNPEVDDLMMPKNVEDE
jgi:hypothetical protein